MSTTPVGVIVSIRKHTLYNLVGSILPLILSLVTIPVYLHHIGDARYGVLAIAWLLLGYFGLFDLGLGAATAQRIAALANGTSKQRAETFWTALAMNSGLGILGGLVIWPVAIFFFGRVFSVDDALRSELAAAIPWLILAVPMATLSGVLTGALQGREQFLELNFISVVSAALTQLVPLFVVWVHGPDLAWLLPSVVLVRAATLGMLFLRCRVHIFQGQKPWLVLEQAKSLLQFGGWITLSALLGPMMVVLDRFVIGATLGAKDVTYYTVPFQLAERSSVLPGALSSALFPRLAALDPTESRELAGTAIQVLAVVMTPLILGGVLLVEPFLSWWLNPDFAVRAGLSGKLLLLGFWVNSFARVPLAQLHGEGRPDVVAKCHTLELLPYLVLLYLGLHYWGLPGAALAFALRAFADCMLLLLFAGTLRVAAFIAIFPFTLLLAALGISELITVGESLWWGMCVVLLCLSLFWSWRSAPQPIIQLIARVRSKEKA